MAKAEYTRSKLTMWFHGAQVARTETSTESRYWRFEDVLNKASEGIISFFMMLRLDNRQERRVTGMCCSASRVMVVQEPRLCLELFLLNNWQCRYEYRLLVVLRIQPTMDILPVIVCESHKQALPGELAEDDDDWFRTSSVERETVELRMSWTISEGTSIHTTSGTQHTE